ncbi:MAG: transposase [Acidobacteria bacterium]|nr:transposase [Acidobacteriota bacterium]
MRRWEVSMGRKRRKFSKEFKADAVELVRKSGKSIPEAARDLDLTESSLRAWVKQVRKGIEVAFAPDTAKNFIDFAHLVLIPH